jgi:hypothetical protein
MKTPSDIARFVESLPERQKSGTLRIWGQWFGRPMDNVHTCTSCEVEEERLVLSFNEGEQLTLWSPTNVLIEGQATLTFPSATQVRWDWYYYGRPKTPENRVFIEYVARDGVIQFSSSKGLAAGDQPRLSEPAAQICGM